MGRFGNVIQTGIEKAVELAADRWVPGGQPDPVIERGMD
jgi:hypothetical protein